MFFSFLPFGIHIHTMNNYLKQFTTNQIPTVQADAAVFDLEEGKRKQVQEILKANPRK